MIKKQQQSFKLFTHVNQNSAVRNSFEAKQLLLGASDLACKKPSAAPAKHIFSKKLQDLLQTREQYKQERYSLSDYGQRLWWRLFKNIKIFQK